MIVSKNLLDGSVELKRNEIINPFGFGMAFYPVKKCDRGLIDKIQSYIINDKAVIIFWNDGKKTVATVDERDIFDKELGFAIAVFKYDNIHSKASYKRMLNCIKEGTFITKKQIDGKMVAETKCYLKMFMEDYFNNVTFKDMEKSRKFLKALKITGKREKIHD